jgi:hypothetical protein
VLASRLERRAALLGAGLVLVLGVGTIAGSHAISRDVRDRSTRALAAAGLADATVRVDGRHVSVSAATSAEAARADTLLRDLDGVRDATARSVPVPAGKRATAPPATAPVLELRRDGARVSIAGTVADAGAAADLKIAAAVAFDTTVIGDVVVEPSVGDAAWIDPVARVLPALNGVRALRLIVDGDGALELAGVVSTEGGAAALVRRVEDEVPDLVVVDRLDVRPEG